MAKNITLLGADYSDVPAVVLPQTGGGTAKFIEESEILQGNTRIWYGTSDTAAATREKAVTVSGLTALTAGDVFVVTFTNGQTYNGGPRLNVNGLGYKAIRRLTGTNAARYEWNDGETVIFLYNGTYFLIVNGGAADTTYYGRTRLNNGATSTSTKLALSLSGMNSFSENMVSGYPVYNAEATYAVGDMVRYNYSTWKCTTAITTAEAWTAAHWEQLPALQKQLKDFTVGEMKAL